MSKMSVTANTFNITHDAESGMFEAHVTLDEGKVTTHHIVCVPGHISVSYRMLRPALITAAKAQRNSGRFFSRIDRNNSIADRVHETAFAGPSLLDQLLGRAA